MIVVSKKPKRDEQGKFAKGSRLGKKVFSLRLQKGYQERFIELAEKREINTTELARQIIEQYIDKNNDGY